MSALWNFLAVLVGAVVTYFVSKHYYKAASDDLRKAVEKLLVETLRIRKVLGDPEAGP